MPKSNSADQRTIDVKPQLLFFRNALKVWLKIGLLSFGGPAGQIALLDWTEA